jgi:hypothetical protein
MPFPRLFILFFVNLLLGAATALAQPPATNPSAVPDAAPVRPFRQPPQDSTAISRLPDIRAQDVCILPDPSTQTWRQEDQPIFQDNGGHGMIFHTFAGQLMLVLHAPDGRGPHPLLFELEDTGETLRILRPFPAG